MKFWVGNGYKTTPGAGSGRTFDIIAKVSDLVARKWGIINTQRFSRPVPRPPPCPTKKHPLNIFFRYPPSKTGQGLERPKGKYPPQDFLPVSAWRDYPQDSAWRKGKHTSKGFLPVSAWQDCPRPPPGPGENTPSRFPFRSPPGETAPGVRLILCEASEFTTDGPLQAPESLLRIRPLGNDRSRSLTTDTENS